MSVTSRITQRIPSQRFEIIKDRIAEIILCELESQKALNVQDKETLAILNNTKLFSERMRKLSSSQSYAIVLINASMDFSNQHQTYSKNAVTYFLDFYGGDTSSQNIAGDTRSADRTQRLIGIVRSILESPHWARLGFDPSISEQIIASRKIQTVRRMEEVDTRDSMDSVMYRMLFMVETSETTETLSGVDLKNAITNVKISDTELGYEYEYEET